jgi:DNA adenine methylase
MHLAYLPVSREIFYDIKEGRTKPKNKLERAAFYYYLLSTSFGSKRGHFAMSKSQARKNIYRNFSVWSQRLKGVTIENLSFEALIQEYDRSGTLFYCDPPYVGTEGQYELEDGFGLAEHRKLAEILRGIKGNFVLSYNDCPLVRELYEGCKFREVEVRYTLGADVSSRTPSKEVIISG